MYTVNFFRWSGVANILGGLLLAISLFVHPEEVHTPQNLGSGAWAIAHILAMVATLIVLLGLPGLYIRQMNETGRLGGIGFVLTFIGTACVFALNWSDGFVVPLVATLAPDFITAVFTTEAGKTLFLVVAISVVTFALGWLLLGIAIFRGRVLARWASLPAMLGALLLVFSEGMPLPVLWTGGTLFGLGLVWLGVSLFNQATN